MFFAVDLNSAKSLARARSLCWKISVISITLFGLLSTQTFAASFDCKKAVSWVEKTVCSNPELSKLDEEMAKAYHDALAGLSPEGQKETKQYQKQWLKNLSSYSKAKLKLKFGDGAEDAESALQDAYEGRIKQLQQSLIKFSDRIFRNVYVDHTDIEEGCLIYSQKELTYPQIENPRNDNEKFWNNFISQRANNYYEDNLGVCESVHEKYAISFSNKRMISLHYELIVKMPGEYTYQEVSISWLLEDKRELQASDLFDDKTSWRTQLVALASPKLKEQEVNNKKTYKIEPSKLMKIVTSPSSWVFSKDGLGIQFTGDDFEGSTTPFAFVITIDWKDIDPYLGKNGHSLIYE